MRSMESGLINIYIIIPADRFMLLHRADLPWNMSCLHLVGETSLPLSCLWRCFTWCLFLFAISRSMRRGADTDTRQREAWVLITGSAVNPGAPEHVLGHKKPASMSLFCQHRDQAAYSTEPHSAPYGNCQSFTETLQPPSLPLFWDSAGWRITFQLMPGASCLSVSFIIDGCYWLTSPPLPSLNRVQTHKAFYHTNMQAGSIQALQRSMFPYKEPVNPNPIPQGLEPCDLLTVVPKSDFSCDGALYTLCCVQLYIYMDSSCSVIELVVVVLVSGIFLPKIEYGNSCPSER